MTSQQQLAISTESKKLPAEAFIREKINATGSTPEKVGKVVCSFLDTATTSFGRSTHYNIREEQQAAELQAHDQMMALDRDLYTAFLMLPGITDRCRQLGLRNLLSLKRTRDDGMISQEQETSVLYALLRKVPIHRLLKIIDAFRFSDSSQGIAKTNNARTRKLILRTLLNSKNLEFWAVKYRQKIRRALVHAWGNRRASIVRNILAKKPHSRTPKEWGILKSLIDKNVFIRSTKKVDHQLNTIYECVGFVLGVRDNTLPLLKAFEDAKKDLSAGAILMPEVLEGIRSSYHPKVPKEEVIRLTTKSGSLTHNQKLNMQRQIEDAGAVVEFDPNQYDAIKLYIYAFERGMTKSIEKALDDKARAAAKGFPIEYRNVAVLVDASKSMEGDTSQFLRPIATALSLRDMLQYTGKRFTTAYAGGGLVRPGDDRLILPRGDSSLAEVLVELLKQDDRPDAVYVISDGYENCPAGRFAEVVLQLRSIGIHVPIYHLNPVFAAESKEVRRLSPEIPTMPAMRADVLGLSVLRGLLDTDPVAAITTLFGIALESEPMKKALS